MSIRWEELQQGPQLCDKCNKKVTNVDEVLACGMAPGYVLDEDGSPTGCVKLLCRNCANSNDHTFQPCQCFTFGDHQNILWCSDCSKAFDKCNSCKGNLCKYCQVDNTKEYGSLCQHCCWAMSELIGKLPEGVSFGCPPWPRYVIPEKIQKAVQELHNSLPSKKKRSVESSSSDNVASSNEKRKENATDTAKIQYMFILLWKSGGPYREKDAKVVGVYSNKTLAVEGAKIKFEDLSNGCYKGGRWTEPYIFEKTVDKTTGANDQDDDIVLLKQVDHDGEYEQINLQKILLDEPIGNKPSAAKRGRNF